jgi:K+-transporting ATPase ATPase A chain
MTASGWIQIVVYFAAVLLVPKPLGIFMHRVFEGGDHFLKRPLGWLERLVYRLLNLALDHRFGPPAATPGTPGP